MGFTGLTRRLDEDELGSLVEGFEAWAAGSVIALGGRLVKTMGDEVLFAALEPEVGIEAALLLAAGWGRDQPPVRVGLATGRVVHRMGDVFGTPVNLASRLTAFARPGSVLVGRHDRRGGERDARRGCARPVAAVGARPRDRRAVAAHGDPAHRSPKTYQSGTNRTFLARPARTTALGAPDQATDGQHRAPSGRWVEERQPSRVSAWGGVGSMSALEPLPFWAPAAAATRDDDSADRLHALVAIAKVVASAEAFDDVLRLTAAEARAALGAASLSLSVWERERGWLRVVLNVGDLGPGERPDGTGEVYPVTEYSCIEALLDSQPYVQQVDADPATPGYDAAVVGLLRDLGKGSCMGVPVVLEGRVWGELFATRYPGDRPYGREDLDFAGPSPGRSQRGLPRSATSSRWPGWPTPTS